MRVPSVVLLQRGVLVVPQLEHCWPGVASDGCDDFGDLSVAGDRGGTALGEDGDEVNGAVDGAGEGDSPTDGWVVKPGSFFKLVIVILILGQT